MIHLLDVNVLIALIDPKHVSNQRAKAWFIEIGSSAWATCPITENGAVRIVGARSYPNSPGAPTVVIQTLERLKAIGSHIFWPDSISLLNNSKVDSARIATSAQITDTYLLALAIANGGRLATFDRRLSPVAVRGGGAALQLLA